jgi:hypothetical protein
LVKDEYHLAEIKFNDPLLPKILKVFWIDGEGMTLSIEGVDLVLLVIIKASLWEILMVAIHFHAHWLIMMHLNLIFIKLWDSYHFFVSDVPKKVVMGSRVVVEKVHKETVFPDPAASHVRVTELLVHHSVVINATKFVDLYLC